MHIRIETHSLHVSLSPRANFVTRYFTPLPITFGPQDAQSTAAAKTFVLRKAGEATPDDAKTRTYTRSRSVNDR